jgi:hypothetical protein
MRLVDIGVEQAIKQGQGEPPREPRWSVAALGVPLPMVVALLAQTVVVVLWAGRQSDKLDAVAEQLKEIKTEVYHQTDATRDLALRDDRIAELQRRVQILEAYQDGRRR